MSPVPRASTSLSTSSTAQVQSAAVPILPSADLDRAQACYTYLGFQVQCRAEDYLQIALGSIELHFYLAPEHDPFTNSAGCYLRVDDPAALRAAWSADGVDCLECPTPAHYGATLFAVIDPDGNTLRIGPSAASC